MPQSSNGQQPERTRGGGAATLNRAARTAAWAADTVFEAADTVFEAAATAFEAAQQLPAVPAATARFVPPAGRAVSTAVRHPRTVLDRARRFPVAAAMIRHAVEPILTGRVDDWRAEYAYTTGVQAFIYGFPYIYNAQLRHDWITEPRDPEFVPYAAVNHFWHASRLINAAYRDGGCPNNDTLYSVAWVDLSDEPVILSHPDMANRYFTFELMGFTSDNFDYISQRATGKEAGHFALTGPGWKGNLPVGIKRVKPAPTPWILVLGRTFVDGPEDLPNVHVRQQQYRLTPLSLWGDPSAKVPERRNVYAPPRTAEDPLGPWKSLNAMLAENPPPVHHALLLNQFARIGIGPGLDVEAQPEVVKQGLIRAAAIGMPLLRQQFLSGSWATVVNGWRYPPAEEGRFGDDFLQRAADQSLAGITANDPAEAIYLVNFEDSDGAKLSPQGRYTLSFGPGDLPPVDAFWSLTAYTQADMNLIPNPGSRYSVGDRTDLIRDADGGLTIHLQPDSPEPGRKPNWLPTSAQDPWFVILRMYRPHHSVVQCTWECPGITRIA